MMMAMMETMETTETTEDHGAVLRRLRVRVTRLCSVRAYSSER